MGAADQLNVPLCPAAVTLLMSWFAHGLPLQSVARTTPRPYSLLMQQARS